MKSKEEKKELLNKFTSHDERDLESLRDKIQFVIDQKEINMVVVQELFAVKAHLEVKREHFITRLISLYKQGYTD